ncbi:shikimate dehydrogenase [Aquibacillus sediminis]|uniref:shikimate dehydrogenase n=1 Tax=Aquibacillus sediminis TaxID=2574734 RepID=UPI0011091260|nr:shikimate dehydrogenase [Aquibacillus sediminis]
MDLKLGLIGYPIKHSLSPWIHQQFMDTLGVEGRYDLYESPPEQLGETINQLRDQQLDGFNITVPYKQKIIPYLDELDSDAKEIGAVNTVVQTNGKWKGYNTDGAGYVRSVKQSYPNLFAPNHRVLILGAGGAARGIYRALVHEAFTTVDIANRTLERADDLLDLKTEDVTTNILSFKDAEQALSKYDFIVQTTSVGMKPNVEDQIISLEQLKPNTIVSDIVYQPLLTSFLKDAKQRGGLIHQGHTMLLYQAQLAFRHWSGASVPAQDILIELEKRL